MPTRRTLALAIAAGLAASSVPASESVPHTEWGAPDLSGTWTTATSTPLERPEIHAGVAVLTPAEAKAAEKRAAEFWRARGENPPPGSVGGYNLEWLEVGVTSVPDRRTALIVEPEDGRIPWKPEALAIYQQHRARYGVGPFEAHTDLDTGERCISDGVTMVPLQPYNMNFRIVQTEDHVVILHEMYHEVRVVHLDERPYLPDDMGQWLGDARGHWDGDTLVIVTKSFADQLDEYWAWYWRAARPTLTVTERLRRVDETTIDYSFTIDDPLMFTEPWTASAPMTSDQASRGATSGPLYEFACHEGNYSLSNVLRGARFQEKHAGD